MNSHRELTDPWDVEVTNGSVLLVGDFHDVTAAIALARTVPGVGTPSLKSRSWAGPAPQSAVRS